MRSLLLIAVWFGLGYELTEFVGESIEPTSTSNAAPAMPPSLPSAGAIHDGLGRTALPSEATYLFDRV